MKICELWGMPLASLLPGVGTSVYIASKLYSIRKNSSHELPEEVVRQKRFFKDLRDMAIIITLATILALTLREILRTENQIKLLKAHHTEHVVR